MAAASMLFPFLSMWHFQHSPIIHIALYIYIHITIHYMHYFPLILKQCFLMPTSLQTFNTEDGWRRTVLLVFCWPWTASRLNLSRVLNSPKMRRAETVAWRKRCSIATTVVLPPEKLQRPPSRKTSACAERNKLKLHDRRKFEALRVDLLVVHVKRSPKQKQRIDLQGSDESKRQTTNNR